MHIIRLVCTVCAIVQRFGRMRVGGRADYRYTLWITALLFIGTLLV